MDAEWPDNRPFRSEIETLQNRTVHRSVQSSELPDGTGDGRRATANGDGARAIALIDDHEFTRGCIATCLEVMCRDTTVSTFATVSDFVLAGPGGFRLAIYHAHAGAGQAGVGGAIPKLIHEMKPTPVLVVSDVDDIDAMMEALTAGVRGYIPTISTSLRVTIEVMRLVTAGGVFAPVTPSLLQQAREQPPSPDLPTDRFTPRQLAVLERLKRGSANKLIAHELSMSEGTVKVHVRNIMKKLRATNRTQAVFRAYSPAGDSDPFNGRKVPG